jgi:hypothetical protein
LRRVFSRRSRRRSLRSWLFSSLVSLVIRSPRRGILFCRDVPLGSRPSLMSQMV